MTIHEQKQAGYITLKEASERFGYAPDYIGQLIRKGKVEGKQVYANVAWMTTAEAIEEYMSQEKRTAKTDSPNILTLERVVDHMGDPGVIFLTTWLLRLALAMLVVSTLFLFYFLSIAIEHKLAERAEQRLAAQMIVIKHEQIAPGNASPHISYEK